MKKKLIIILVIPAFLFLASCEKDWNQVNTSGNNSFLFY